MSKQKIQKVYPLTPMQEGMLYHAMLDPNSSSYFTQLELGISGEFDHAVFEKSLNELIQTYDILRTAFVYQQLQKPRQVVLAERHLDVYREDLSHLNHQEQQKVLDQYKKQVRKQGFHLTNDLLLKVAVFQLNETNWHLIWSNHHIIMDGWSMGVLMKKLFHYYESYRNGRTPDRSQGKPYADYIQWLGKQNKQEAESYWEERLDGAVQHQGLLEQKEANGQYDHQEWTFTWDAQTVQAIQNVARQCQVTAPNLFQAVWSVLLGTYHVTDDVTFGTVVSGRPPSVSGIERMAGLFINTIPVRVILDQKQTFKQLFQKVQQHALEAENYDFMPLYDIQQKTAAGGQLFDHLVGFENYPLDQELSGGTMSARLGFSIDVKDGFEQTNFDLNVLVYPGETWTLKIKYNAIAFEEKVIENISKHLTNLMKQIIQNPDACLHDVTCITEEEKQQIKAWNQTERDYPKHLSIPELFNERVKTQPDHLALVEGDRTFTYEELGQEIRRLAGSLIENGVQPGDAVGVYMNRSADAVIAILAVVHAGAAYVPIDPSQPEERIRFMLEDSGATILLHADSPPPVAEQIKAVHVTSKPHHSHMEVSVRTSPSHLAYIMYTSGSTGQPKGVQIEHQHIVRLACSQEKLGLTKSDRMAHTGAVSFDAITFEIFTTLLGGATLYPVARDTLLDIHRFEQFIQTHQITTLFLTTGLFNQLAQQRPQMFKGLTTLITGGDVINVKSAELVKQHHPALVLLNAYGPTENTTISTIYEVRGDETGPIPIGQPINHSSAYILDDDQRLQPIGAPGELYVGGDGVARGYLNRPDLTNQVFMADPFKSSGRLYRTGDLARYGADGQIEFLGRTDDQVKIRGFRIELGEIETVLQQKAGIDDAVVLVHSFSTDEKEITAYFTGTMTEEEVRDVFNQELPAYMVPHHVMKLNAFPLTSNGKVDRKALPKPDEAHQEKKEIIPPETETEKALAQIWEELLGKTVGVDEHFFMAGGHSLKAMMMSAKIQEVLQKEVPIQVIFEKPTIRSLAIYIDQDGQEETMHPILPAEQVDEYPVSPAQRRLYILQTLEPDSTNYHIPIVLTLEGTLEYQRLKSAFDQLIQTHEILRTSFHMNGEDIVQRVNDWTAFDLPVHHIKEEEAEAFLSEHQSPFDLTAAPLLRAQLLKVSENRHLLVLEAHHLITDGSSMKTFIQDLAKAYDGEALTERAIHYKDYAVWQLSEEETEKQKEHEAYWLKQFEGDLPVLELPTDYSRPVERDFSGERFMFGCDQATTQRIHDLLQKTDTTMYMFLLSAFQVLLATYSGQEDIIVGSPVAGRTHPDIQDMPGMFINTVAMRGKPVQTKTFLQLLEEIKETSVDAFAHQSYPLEELIARLPLDRDTTRSPLFSVSFNMQNMEVPALKLGDLHISPYAIQHHSVKFDLSLEVFEREGALKLSFDYAAALFKEETVRRFGTHLLAIIREAVQHPEAQIGLLPILDQHEQIERLEKKDEVQTNCHEPFHVQFSRQAKETPDAIAVMDNQRKLTYRELEEMSNALGSELKVRGVEKEKTVALILDRSVYVIVSMLGVMKAGGAFVPIDPAFPAERINYTLEDSGAQVIVTNESLVGSYQHHKSIQVVQVEKAVRQSRTLDLPEASSDQLAYVIYTSGTTGKPKGVQLTHRNLSHYVNWLTNEVTLQECDRTALLSSYAYDLGYTSIFPVLKAGGTLYVPRENVYTDPVRLMRFIDEQELTYIKMTPSLFHMMADSKDHAFNALRLVILGGEPIVSEDVETFMEQHSCVAVMNHYGPTETTIGTVTKVITKQELGALKDRSVIGQPIAHTRALVLNRQQRLVPYGAPGELYISGEGVSRGYLNQPELTAERFLENPYFPEERMYRTGDLVRQHANGDIEFLGRIDDQVKIRGYRIEKQEIEHAARAQLSIQEVYVKVLHMSRLPELALYYTAPEPIGTLTFREKLAETLPDYMIPTYFVKVDHIPLTQNGKVDAKSLPLPHEVHMNRAVHTAPETELEQTLCDIWSEVLGVEQIGVHDHFFELGGHSLKGMVLISKMQANLNKHVPLKVLFEKPTIREMAAYLEKVGSSDMTSIHPAEKQDFYPVSSAQKRMYVLQQLHPEAVTYHMPAVLMMEGSLDVKQLEEALQALIERHESLRTAFVEIDGVPVQKVYRRVPFTLEMVEVENGHEQPVIDAFITPFSLHQAPLMRAKVAKLSDEKYVFMMDMHHIIADGVTRSLLIQELAELYEKKTLPPVQLHYKDYAVWQQEEKQQALLEKQRQYWLEQYAEPPEDLALPLDFPRPHVQSFEGDRVDRWLSPEKVQTIKALMAEKGVSMNMVMQTAFAIFLSKLTGQTDIVIGAVTAGRTHAAIERVPGMFVNTLALRQEVQLDETTAQLLEKMKDRSLSAYEHQDVPFEELVAQLDLPKDTSRNPLFSVMLTTDDRDMTLPNLNGLKLSQKQQETVHAKFDVTLGIFEEKDQVGVRFEYATALFKKKTIQRWSRYFEQIIDEMLAKLNEPISSISILTEDEKQELINEWSGPVLNVPSDQTVHELIKAKTFEAPNQKAATFRGTSWTYEELNSRANTVASRLISNGIKRGDRVGILTRPSLDMTAAVLGVLKTGAAFVPIDADYPDQRITYMLEDCGAEILLMQKGLTAPASFTGHVLFIEDAVEGEAQNIQVHVKPTDLAYMIYTSGTTGQPKGVMVEHQSLVNLAFWHNDAFQVTNADRTAKYAGFGFDASIWEMFPTWIAGAELHIIDEAIRLDMIKLNTYFNDENITIAFLPTQLCEQFMSMDNHSLRYLLTGGDKLKQVKPVPYQLVNNYGPTENTVVATSGIINPDQGTLPIGKAIANTRFYIMGSLYDLSPPGVPGELVIAGKGLARGYWNLPEETEIRFVPDPFYPGERMYLTGDLVKWTEDGELIYLGRKDHQVNIRGFRIELSEIEAQLLALSDVKEAVVTTIKDASDQDTLAAYVITDNETEDLKESLKRTLPDYMIPSWIIKLDYLPMTANGKVDLKALPAPDMEAGQTAYEAPRDEVETLLCDIWEDVLGVSEVGIHDHFFFLGGDSIKGIQMASRLTQAGWKLDMKLLFQYPTIAELRPYIEEADQLTADQSSIEGEVMLTPIQRWFFERTFTDQHHWNLSMMLHAPNGFDLSMTEQVMQKLLSHHDALRMVYRQENDSILQYNQRELTEPIAMISHDVSKEHDVKKAISTYANEYQRQLNLETGPLMKVICLRAKDGDHLLIVTHHLVIDGVSCRILLEDFMSLYQQAAQGQTLVLPPKTHSFKEWAEAIERYAQSKPLKSQSEYWNEIDRMPMTTLPVDHEVTKRKVAQTKAVQMQLSESETEHLLTDIHLPYTTEMNDILLCALGLAVQEWTGESHVHVQLEGHGREDILSGLDVSRTIGWFTSMYPVVLKAKPDQSIAEAIKGTKEMLRRVPNKGIGYGILKYLTATESSGQHVQPEISLNYLGQIDQEVTTELFGPSAYDMGRQASPDSEAVYKLNLSGLVQHNRFKLSCSYCSDEYEEETIQKFMALLKEKIQSIITHCLAQHEREFTPSDFSAGDLEMDEMDDIFDMLEEKLT
ncbi:non-ribosomal peptide synthetase [Bacillus pumilus]|uniref:non-ribosomal peptide synthetase n=2 Tax=Bacillus pumilus TaxID=1408 RepID=UPI001B3A5B3F|nr:non-ribosomal peptide synthetase [Bacillus pumilus]MBQ4816178.1 amino acid adenylation domain-containing protein [Bacillus pumilus]WIG32467.1 non-ribosomal peptide synthetase [Bacillus pumilus]